MLSVFTLTRTKDFSMQEASRRETSGFKLSDMLSGIPASSLFITLKYAFAAISIGPSRQRKLR